MVKWHSVYCDLECENTKYCNSYWMCEPTKYNFRRGKYSILFFLSILGSFLFLSWKC